MEIHPQNPDFRSNTKNFHPCVLGQNSMNVTLFYPFMIYALHEMQNRKVIMHNVSTK